MYLSRVALDVHRRSTAVALVNPQQIHSAVEQAFPGERRRRLWRLDSLENTLYLLILSADMPDLRSLTAQFGTGQPPEVKDYAPLLNRILPGSTWQFRLTANPTKSCPGPAHPGRGIVHAHCSVEYQKQWLLDRAEKHGFWLEPDGFTVVDTHWLQFHKGASRQTVSIRSVTYEGALTVTDAELFKKLLTEGIGRGKAYGLGLMTVIGRRPQNA